MSALALTHPGLLQIAMESLKETNIREEAGKSGQGGRLLWVARVVDPARVKADV